MAAKGQSAAAAMRLTKSTKSSKFVSTAEDIFGRSCSLQTKQTTF